MDNEAAFCRATAPPWEDCPDLKVSRLDENGQDKPSPQGMHWSSSPLSATLMDSASQPQSEAEVDPKIWVVAPAEHSTQFLLPSASWCHPSGHRLHAILPVSFWKLPAGQGAHETDAPEAWKRPGVHALQIKVVPAIHLGAGKKILCGDLFNTFLAWKLKRPKIVRGPWSSVSWSEKVPGEKYWLQRMCSVEHESCDLSKRHTFTFPAVLDGNVQILSRLMDTPDR